MIYNAKALEANEALKLSREFAKQKNEQNTALDKFRQTVVMDNTEVQWEEEEIQQTQKNKLALKADDF